MFDNAGDEKLAFEFPCLFLRLNYSILFHHTACFSSLQRFYSSVLKPECINISLSLSLSLSLSMSSPNTYNVDLITFNISLTQSEHKQS